MTKLDVLDPCHVLVGVGYRRGTRLGEWPGDEQAIAALEPVFRPGWLTETAGLRTGRICRSRGTTSAGWRT